MTLSDVLGIYGVQYFGEDFDVVRPVLCYGLTDEGIRQVISAQHEHNGYVMSEQAKAITFRLHVAPVFPYEWTNDQVSAFKEWGRTVQCFSLRTNRGCVGTVRGL